MTSNPLIRKLMNAVYLSTEQKQQLDELNFNVTTIDRKGTILGEGQQPRFIPLILEGWAARYKSMADGRRQIVGLLLPGDFGDLHAPILDAMDHGIIALCDCTLACVQTDLIDETIQRDGSLARAFWWSALVEKAILRTWVVNLGRRDARERIAHLICELYVRASAVGLAADGRMHLPLTQEDIADATGLTPVHTNRVLRNLRVNGMIELENQTLKIRDHDALISAAAFDPTYLHLRLLRETLRT